jgi:hypothetical protein
MLNSAATPAGSSEARGQTSNETTPRRRMKPTTAPAISAPLAPIPAR